MLTCLETNYPNFNRCFHRFIICITACKQNQNFRSFVMRPEFPFKFNLSRNVSLFRVSLCNNLISVISRVLIGPYLNFCSLTSPTCCNSPRKCISVKRKMRQIAGYQFFTQITSLRQMLYSYRNLFIANQFTGFNMSGILFLSEFSYFQSLIKELSPNFVFHIKQI